MKLIHNNEILIMLAPDESTIETIHTIFTGSFEECQAEASRLNLLDQRGLFNRQVNRLNIKGAREAAMNYFNGLSNEIKNSFGPVLQAVSALPNDIDAIKAIKAVAVPEALIPNKIEIIRLLNTDPIKDAAIKQKLLDIAP